MGHLINELSNAPQPASYVYRLARHTDILLVDEAGAAITGATVDVYADHGVDSYRKTYGPVPDRVLATDGRGVFV